MKKSTNIKTPTTKEILSHKTENNNIDTEHKTINIGNFPHLENKFDEEKKNKMISLQKIKNFKKKSFGQSIKEEIYSYKNKIIIRIKYMILDSHSDRVEYLIFHCIVYFLTILNFIFLCFISSNMSQKLSSNIFIINIFCSSVFMLEILLKLIVLKTEFFSDCFNILDFFIILAGVTEIIIVNLNNNQEGMNIFFYLFF